GEFYYDTANIYPQLIWQLNPTTAQEITDRLTNIDISVVTSGEIPTTRHNIINKLFTHYEGIDYFYCSQSSIGLINGIDTVKVYDKNIENNIVVGYEPIYVALSENGDIITFSHNNSATTVAFDGTIYTVSRPEEPTNTTHNDNEQRIIDTGLTLFFGGVYVVNDAIHLGSIQDFTGVDITKNQAGGDDGKTTYTLTSANTITWNNLVTQLVGGNANLSSRYIQLDLNEIFNGNNKIIDLVDDNNDDIETGGLFAARGTTIGNCSEIKNLGVINGSLTEGGGYIVRANMRYFTVSNCYSTGNISELGGGICGLDVASSGACTITNCYSTGEIGISGGGICGSGAGTSCTIINCYSTGVIGQFGGGICGSSTAADDGTCTISNCYSSGVIGESAGGICGSNTANNDGTCTISNCYTTGAIGESAGGICGSLVAPNGGTCIIRNCYSTGVINLTSAGGICGSDVGSAGGTCTVTKTFSQNVNKIFGSITGDPSNITSSSSDIITKINKTDDNFSFTDFNTLLNNITNNGD
ncbi:MAG: hypothetical protein EBQ92_03465, partial [Proteobacteria bacterium]|nr:hypothetical protein [Pseudomonadota bacterium]